MSNKSGRLLSNVAITVFCAVVAAAPIASARAGEAPQRAPRASAGLEAVELPMAFEANVGQAPATVAFLARGRGYTAFLTQSGAVLALGDGARPPDAAGAAAGKTAPQRRGSLGVTWAGGAASPRVVGLDELPGTSNYIIGPDASRWRTRIATYAAVRYESVYEGIDVDVYGTERSLEYDFRVAPGADARQIRVRFDGADSVRLLDDGSLALDVGGREVRQLPPVAYQADAGARRHVAARYVLASDGEVAIDLGAYDAARQLVVDPVLVYASWFGGSAGYDEGMAIAVDASGATYVAGQTESTNFPATSSAYSSDTSGSYDAFVAKVSADGSTILWATYLGGGSRDVANGVAVDAAGAVYVTGSTDLSGIPFPTTPGAFDTSHNGNTDAFVTKLSPDGSSLVYSTLLGGSALDNSLAVAVDASGAAYVAGQTEDAPVFDFPTTAGAYDTTHNGMTDAFVAKLSADGDSLRYATLVGGSRQEGAAGIAVDAAGSAYVTGLTAWSDFPATQGAFDTSHNGAADGFALQLDPAGSSLVYSTFLGGSQTDAANAIALDASGAAYVVGYTGSPEFPTTAGAFDTSHGADPYDGFVAKIAPGGASLAYSTFLGGSGQEDRAHGVAVDGAGAAYVTGETASPDFPTTEGAFDRTHAGGTDAFATKLSADGSSVLFSTYLGGADDDRGRAVAVIPDGGAVLTGLKRSAGFPNVNGFAGAGPDKYDAFVARLAPSGGELVFSSVLGGNTGEFEIDQSNDVAVGADGSLYVTGYTESMAFPVTPGSVSQSNAGFFDAFVMRVAPDGQTLLYATYLGGGSNDFGWGISVDASGAAYVTGYTFAATPAFPTTPGAFATSPGGGDDAFVVKLAPDGASLLYSTLVGGPGRELSRSIAVDASGAAYIAGSSEGGGFPVTPGAYSTTPAGNYDVTIAKLSADGASLLYGTYVGGAGFDHGHGIAVDAAGSAYVTGRTEQFFSGNFPATPGAFATTHGGLVDAFALKLSADGGSLAYSTYLGGAGQDLGARVAVDASGAAYVTGDAASADFPVTAGAFDPSHNGDADAFVTKVAPDGASLAYSTFLGGASGDSGRGVVVDAAGRAIVTGYALASASPFPTTPDALDTSHNGSNDAVVARLSADGASLDFSTFLGGPSVDAGEAIALGPNGDVYVAGRSASPDFAPGGFGDRDSSNGFVVRLRLPGGAADGGDTAGIHVAGSGSWFLRDSHASGPADASFFYGPADGSWVALAGDWDGDGDDTAGLYDPGSGFFFLRNANGPGPADLTFSYGPAGADWVPVAGDWDGDGDDTVGLYDPGSGFFFLKNTNTAGPADLTFSYGPAGAGWTPLAGDWDGDGDDTVGIYDPATSFFFLKNTNTAGAADLTISFGVGGSGWMPLAGDYDGDGDDTVGLYAPANGFFFLRNVNAAGPADVVYAFGVGGAAPLVGDWDGL